MTQSQSLEGGLQTAPPQFNALKANDALVTVGIGGNDAGLIRRRRGVRQARHHPAVRHRVQEPLRLERQRPQRGSHQRHRTQGGGSIQGIHARAPQAEVMVVGYPDGLPTNGSSCWPLVPISGGDITYFDGLETSLNAVLKSAALANNAKYVDTFTSSVGHDACKASGTAWVNGIIPTSAAFPLHPNKAGEQNMANQVLAGR